MAKKPLKIGLTGGMGAGKSLVLELLKAKRIPVLQTDRLGHDLLMDRGFARTLSGRFGGVILGKGGRVDRVQLGRIVFRDPRKQRLLSALMHPVIRDQVKKWVEGQARRDPPPPLVVVEVPLLFENGFNRWFDGSLCVSAPRLLRRQRLMGRGWTTAEIRRREKFQWSQQAKDEKADWVIHNRGSVQQLKYAVDRWLDSMKRKG